MPRFAGLLPLLLAFSLVSARGLRADEPKALLLPLSVGELHVPEGLELAGKLPLHVHLHGSPKFVRERFEAERGRALLLCVHRNGFSSVYTKFASAEGRLERLLEEVETALREVSKGFRDISRLSVTAFSAGYGAVRTWLANAEDRARIDAIGLADGLHAGYDAPGVPKASQMEPFLAFAREAMAGRKTFLFTHSAIVPPGYASTTECADALVRGLSLERETLTADPGTRAPTSRCRSGRFEILGYAGTEAADHTFHFGLIFEHLRTLGLPTRPLRVALFRGKGVSSGVKNVVATLEGVAEFEWREVSVEDVVGSKLESYDVVIFPGGSGGGQGRALGEEGRAVVREFVRGGGGFVGICAGAYLASNDYPWSLGLLDAKVVDKEHWARGTGPVEIAITDEGARELGFPLRNPTLIYWQGPLLAPAADPRLEDYLPFATFVGDIAEKGAPAGIMPGKTAIAAAPFGSGRAIAFSPHPEKTESLRPLLVNAIHWAAGR